MIEDEAHMWVDDCVYIHKFPLVGDHAVHGLPVYSGFFSLPPKSLPLQPFKVPSHNSGSPNKAIATAKNTDPPTTLDDPRESGSTMRPISTAADFSWGGFRVAISDS